MVPPDSKQQIEDGAFLAEEFDIPPRKAAKLVAGGDASGDLGSAIAQKVSSVDALKGVPAPQSADDFTADTDETRLKPVLHTPNKRAGAG